MVVVSNFDHRLPEILKGLELAHFFGSIEIPSPTARPKPARDLFDRASARLGRPIEDLLYIGDDDPAVLEAIAAHGIRTLDVRALESFERLPEWIASPATLPASRASVSTRTTSPTQDPQPTDLHPTDPTRPGDPVSK